MTDKFPLDDETQAFIRDQLRLYRESGGQEATTVQTPDGATVPVLLLSVRGRRSGRERTTPLIFGRDGASLIVVASLRGYDRHPNWYLNLLAAPDVSIQIETERLAATAVTAEGAERARLWAVMVEHFPPYADYQAATRREIPVVLLTPTARLASGGARG